MIHKNDKTTISKTGESDRCKDKTPLFVRRISAKSPKHMNSTTSQGSPEGPVKIRFLFYIYILSGYIYIYHVIITKITQLVVFKFYSTCRYTQARQYIFMVKP